MICGMQENLSFNQILTEKYKRVEINLIADQL